MEIPEAFSLAKHDQLGAAAATVQSAGRLQSFDFANGEFLHGVTSFPYLKIFLLVNRLNIA